MEDHESLREILVDAAMAAEREVGGAEETDAQARRNVALRLVRAVAGWVLIVLGIAALPLPGPGWLIILLGLSMLPYVWAERMVHQIRRRIPGIPEDGKIPMSSWVAMGAMVLLAAGVSYRYGDTVMQWVRDLV